MMIDEEREALLKRSIRSTCDEKKWDLYALGIMLDHIHVAMLFSTNSSIAQVVQTIKVNSSHLVGRLTDTPDRIPFKWQTEYGVFLFHNERYADVLNYVRNQKHHHESNTLWPELELTDRPQHLRGNLPIASQ
jgi:putative transposase